MKNLWIITLLLCNAAIGQNLIQSGPMNGYSEMREVMVWVQMKSECEVELRYWDATLPDSILKSNPITTNQNDAFTAHLLAITEPGIKYGYDIYANGENQTAGRELYFNSQELWQYRTDPPEFTIAIGSCNYVNEKKYDRPGRSYGDGFEIFEAIEKDQPDMMLWLGDNTYLRESDWFTNTGINARYTHTRSVPELQGLLSTGQHYAIWDDHDYGPNDGNRTFPHKDLTLAAFQNFWANNGYGKSNTGGITSAFQFNDMHFYLLDNRWNRTDYGFKTQEEQILGKEQIDWLIESLKYSRAPFKFVAIGGQVLNSEKVYENYANYEAERAYLLNRIADEGITGVFFLTGDRHHSELNRMELNGIVMYDLTTSPLTAGTHKPKDERSENLVEGTLVYEHNYSLIKVSGPRKNRVLEITVKDKNGKDIWTRIIEQE
jgi:alkaline phosphatase D